MKKRLIPFLVVTLFFILFLSGCQDKDPLLGKWEEPVSGITMEFGEEGSVIMGSKGALISATYQKSDPDILVIKASTDGSIPDQTMNYRFDGESLILTVDGVDTVFTRVR